MRRLLLLRHAKAVPAAGHDDHARGLIERGRRDAARIAAMIAEAGLIPDLIVHSGAERARETAAIVAGAWPQRVDVRVNPALYDASRQAVLAVARELLDAAATAMIVAHNPGVADLANALVGGGKRSDIARMANKFPTAALAVFELDAPLWRDLAPGSARLLRFATPDDARVVGA
jgi:phosphohistidine phosphatase